MRETLAALLGQKLPPPLEDALERLLLLDRFDHLCQEAQRLPDSSPFAERFLRLLNVRTKVAEQDLALVPKHGPVVAVANHPFGLIEGAILAALLPSVRPDVKIMANYLLGTIPAARDCCIFVDPFESEHTIRTNPKGLKESVAWLKQGGLLAVFPAGEVAHLNFKERAITDPEWNHSIARLIRLTGATVLPIYFLGANSALFQLLGFLHPRVRTALLTHEFLNKTNQAIELRIGSPIAPAKLRRYQDDVALIRYLRHRTYFLQDRGAARKMRSFVIEPPAAAVLKELLASEIAKLPPERTLVETEESLVLLAKAREIPNVLHEIGRLREVSFRRCGEGTGKAVDLDAFDDSTGTCSFGTVRQTRWWVRIVWGRRRKFLRMPAPLASIPGNYSTGRVPFSTGSNPRLNWAVPSFARNIKKHSRHCYCYGEASASSSCAIPSTRCSLAR